MTKIRALLGAAATVVSATLLLLVGGTAAWAMPEPEPGAPGTGAGTGAGAGFVPAGDPGPASTGGTSVWEIVLPAAGAALLAVGVTLLVTHLVAARRAASRRPATT